MFGLSFLNAGSLFLLAAIAIPLLVHLFARRRPKRVVFSSLRFIRQVQQQQRKRLSLRQLLLLILRTLVLLLAILAIFRPVIQAPGLRRSDRHPRTAVALIVDNSYSMDWLVDTRTALEHAADNALALNAILSDGDMTLPLSRDRGWNRLNGRLRPGPITDDAFSELTVIPLAVPLDTLLVEAARLLVQSDLPNREIYLFSDAQSEDISVKLDIPWFIVPSGMSADRANISCQNARIEQSLTERRIEQQIGFDVVNHSNAPMRDILCSLVLDDRTVAETVVDLEPRQRLRANLTAWIERSGWRSGYVEVKNERQLYDNRAWLAFEYDLEPRIGVITRRNALPVPLSAGLEVFVDKGGVTLLQGDEPLEQLRAFDAIIVYDAEWSARLAFALESLRDGGGFLFLASADMSSDWRDWLAEQLNVRLTTYDASAMLSVSAIGAHHPVMQPLAGTALDRAEVKGVWRSSSTDAVELLAVGGQALAYDVVDVYLWTFDVGALDSPLLLDSAFPVMLYRTLQSLSGAEMGGSRTVGDRLYAGGQTVRTPEGERLYTRQTSLVANTPGVWTLGDGDATLRVAVNLDYAESDYQPFPTGTPNLLSEEDWLEQALPGRYGFETWKLLLGAALLLLAAEMLLVKRGEKAAGRETS